MYSNLYYVSFLNGLIKLILELCEEGVAGIVRKVMSSGKDVDMVKRMAKERREVEVANGGGYSV